MLKPDSLALTIAQELMQHFEAAQEAAAAQEAHKQATQAATQDTVCMEEIEPSKKRRKAGETAGLSSRLG